MRPEVRTLLLFSVPLLVAGPTSGGDLIMTITKPSFLILDANRVGPSVFSRPPKLSACQPAAKPYFAPVYVCVCGASTFAVSPELLNRKGRIAAYFQRSYGNVLPPLYTRPPPLLEKREGATDR